MKDRLRTLLPPEADSWHTSLMAVVLVVLVHAAITERLDDSIRTTLLVLGMLVLVLLPRWPLDWRFWALVTSVLAGQAALAPFTVPNHHYALTWTSFALALTLSTPVEQRDGLVRQAAAWIIVAIMGLATVQRLGSAGFRDGSYLGYVLATGGFLRPVLGLCASCVETMSANQDAVAAFRTTVPEPGHSITLGVLPHLPDLKAGTRWFGASILAIEAWVAAWFLLRREHRLAHWSLLFFAGTLGVIRQELLFISVISMLGLLSCPPRLTWERRAYALAVVAFAAGALG